METVSLTGSMVSAGELAVSNPDWLRLPDGVNWKGAWGALTTYDEGDAVLYKTANGNYHAFVSKAGHNVGNIPPDTYLWWTRLVQSEWGDSA